MERQVTIITEWFGCQYCTATIITIVFAVVVAVVVKFLVKFQANTARKNNQRVVSLSSVLFGVNVI